MLHIQPNELKHFMLTAFMKLGVPKEDAEKCADILITSDLRGIESHGIGRLRMYSLNLKLSGNHPPLPLWMGTMV